MSKQTPGVEWYVAENEADWERLCTPPTPTAHSRLDVTGSLGALAVLLFLLVSASDWWWRSTQAASHQHPVEVHPTTQKELESAAQSADSLAASFNGGAATTDGGRQLALEDNGLIAAVKADKAGAQFDLNVRLLVQQGDRAAVSVRAPATAGAPAYRQTRFYQRTSTAWVRTAPDAMLWGPERSLETPSFVFRFRQNDAATVIAVAPQVETLSTTIRRNFGLTVMPGAAKLVIDVSVTESPGSARFQQHNSACFGMGDRVEVASPVVYQAPVELSDADLLVQSMALPLLSHVLAEVNERDAISSAWQPLMSGLCLWQVWDLDLPLAAWRKDVLRWIYVAVPGADPRQPIVLPEHYTALCAAHRLWLPSPARLGIPLICARPEWEELSFPLWRLRAPPTHLDQLTLSMSPDAYVSQSSSVPHPGQTVALATLVEYIVATYGRERLPALMAGLGHYDKWETLIPAVFGVSAAEFEAGWQVYLVTYYGS